MPIRSDNAIEDAAAVCCGDQHSTIGGEEKRQVAGCAAHGQRVNRAQREVDRQQFARAGDPQWLRRERQVVSEHFEAGRLRL